MLRNKIICFLCIIVIGIVGCETPCKGESSLCQLTVSPEDMEKNPIDGVTVSICKVASISGTDYFPAEGFETSGISIAGVVNNPSGENAKTILDYVKEHNIPSISVSTTEGKAVFSSLDMGIWLVFCEEGQAYSFNPFLVFLPQIINGQINYDVSSAPKTEENHPNGKSIYVIKKWEDNNNAAKKRPDNITVYLKLDGNVIDTVTLHSANGWAHTFTNLPKEGKYTVEEKKVNGYTAAYNGDGESGLVITNTYKSGENLPQTGQLWWPIGFISIIGVAFMVLAIIEFKGKRNGKEEK